MRWLHIVISAILVVSFSVGSLGCDNSKIKEAMFQYLNGIVSEKLSKAQKEYSLYSFNAKTLGIYDEKIKEAQSKLDAIIKNNERLKQTWSGSGFTQGPFVYRTSEFTMADWAKEIDAARFLYSLRQDYEWVKLCKANEDFLSDYIKDLELYFSSFKVQYSQWGVRKLQDNSLLIEGFGLGLSSQKLSAGQWYYYPTANNFETADYQAQAFLKRINDQVETYDKARQAHYQKAKKDLEELDKLKYFVDFANLFNFFNPQSK